MILARLPIARLTRTPRAWVSIVACAALAIVAALLVRRIASTHGASDALLGTYAPLALPLVAYAIVAATLGGEGVARAVRPVVSLGASPFGSALGAVVVAIAASALLGAALGSAVAAIAHGWGDPPLRHDLATTAWVGALGGAAYAALFSFGSSFGRRGGGRTIALVLDFLFGSGAGGWSFLTPRGQIRNLLGGRAPLDVSQREAIVVLASLVVVFGALAVSRARRGA